MADTKLTALGAGTPFPRNLYGVDTLGVSRKFVPQQVINVKDFGAVGDGIHDDAPNIQAAYNWNQLATSASSSAGSTTYTFTSVPDWVYTTMKIACITEASADVTFSIGTPGVVNDTAHGLSANDPVRFRAFGYLGKDATAPFNEISQNAVLYIKTVLNANSYTVSNSPGGTAINFSTTGTAGTDAVRKRYTVKTIRGIVTGKTATTVVTDVAFSKTVNSGDVISFGGNKGTIYFPPGRYLMNSGVDINDDATLDQPYFTFEGADGAILIGNFAGFLFRRNLGASQLTAGMRRFAGLNLTNGHVDGGCIMLQATIGGSIDNCQLSGIRCVELAYTQSCYVNGCTFSAGGSASTSAYGITCGDNGSITNCDITGFGGGGVYLTGRGIDIHGCRFEINRFGVQSGFDSYGNQVAAGGFRITSSTFESNLRHINLLGATGFYIGECSMIGFPNAVGGATPDYGIFFAADATNQGRVANVGVGDSFTQYAIYVSGGSNKGYLTFENVLAKNVFASGVGTWRFPTTAAYAKWVDCSEVGLSGNITAIVPIWTFSQLPSGLNLREGDEFDISDATVNTFGANVTTGGGSNRVRVRWNGTNWRVIAI